MRDLGETTLTNFTRIPEELDKFLEARRTLLIKGYAGTGKTTLALEILQRAGLPDCIYFSTRVPPTVLYEHYPWLRDKVVLGPEEMRFLETRQETPEQLLNRLRDQLLKMERPFLVVDTWDAMAAEMDVKERMRTAKAILATPYMTGGATILVEENGENSYLDFLADGVVLLTLTEVYGEAEEGRVYEDHLEKRTVREIELKKLRGMKISNRKYIFTLEGGKFRVFPTFYEDLGIKPDIINDLQGGSISSGIPDFDVITGGFKRGSFNLFEVEHGVDLRYMQLQTQIAWNAVGNGRGVIVVPSMGEKYPAELTREVVTHLPNSKDFESEVEYIKELCKRRFSEEQFRKGLMIFLGFDTIANRYGYDSVLAIAERTINFAQENGAVVIGTMKRGIKHLSYMTHVADTHFVFKDVANALTVYGMRPKTGLYAVDLIDNRVRLIPIV
jgi:KaiC/GvpD/RAD55 family RecA-like ATPase